MNVEVDELEKGIKWSKGLQQRFELLASLQQSLEKKHIPGLIIKKSDENELISNN